MTEILAQPLASRRRKARARDWKSLGFVAFAAGALAAEFPLKAGAWGVAYRFVSARTGQATAMAVLGAATVG